MQAKVTWDNEMHFTGNADSGFNVSLDTSTEFGGNEDGFKPIELILIGLAGCTAMDVISILKKKKQDVSGFEVVVHAERAEEHPKIFTNILLEYLVTGRNINKEAVDRAIELSSTRYCPAQAMLGKVVPIENRAIILEV